MELWAALLCRLDVLHAVMHLTKFQAAPREDHLKAACRNWEYLKNHLRFGVLIDPSSPVFSSAATTVDKKLFKNVFPDATEDKTSGFLGKTQLLVSKCGHVLILICIQIKEMAAVELDMWLWSGILQWFQKQPSRRLYKNLLTEASLWHAGN